MVAGNNFGGEFGKSGAIRQSFAHQNLYHKSAWGKTPRSMNTEQIVRNMHGNYKL